ncbi:MAG: FecR family protein [Bacteroidota bacterium]
MPAKEKEHIRYLLLRYLDNTSTDEEKGKLFEYLEKSKEDDEWADIMEQMIHAEPVLKEYDPAKWQPVIEQLKEYNAAQEAVQMAPVRQLNVRKRSMWWAAAAVLLIAAGYFIANRQPEKTSGNIPADNIVVHDAAPGSNKAILTRADGSTIILDNAANGTLSEEGNAKVVKLADGRLAYIAENDKSSEAVYNTMSTPRGGQYRLTLPDGTEVWLNAASSITYPTAFTGNERNVTISGEAYFEVAKDASKPFHVKVNEMTIEVLGTHFNVNAYQDESVIKTTLLEGAVKVVSGNASGLLKPGQQAQLHKDGNIALINDANTEEAVAWKNGGFYFEEADIKSIMRQVERWYNVKVAYQGEIPEGHYKGRPSRNLTLTQMLKVFEYSGLKFKIEGNTMTVFE